VTRTGSELGIWGLFLLLSFIWGELSISSGMLAIGFGGVIVLALPSLVAGTGDDWLPAIGGTLAVALAAMAYAVAVVYTRKRLSGKPVMTEADGSMRAPTPLEISFGQVFIGMLVITALGLLFERPDAGLVALPESAEAILSMLWLGLAGTGVAYLLYFAIIARWGATRATLMAYVMPVVAIALGFIALDERLQLLELIGAALIISGVVLVNANVGRPVSAAPAAAD
jgi:drug/metabolite transporter (DMT)-like permease